MASQALQQRKGKDTPEYQRVLNNMEDITRALSTTPGAEEALSLKYKQKRWCDASASTSEKELVQLVLVRIEQNADQFYVFTSMLEDIPGMDQIVKFLRFTGKFAIAFWPGNIKHVSYIITCIRCMRTSQVVSHTIPQFSS